MTNHIFQAKQNFTLLLFMYNFTIDRDYYQSNTALPCGWNSLGANVRD